MKLTPHKMVLIAIASLALAAGCSDDDSTPGTGGSGGSGTGGSGGSSSGDGNLSIVLGAEETIPEGLSAGDEGCDECITDGYSVTFSRYIVTVGFTQMSQLDGANPQSSSVVGVADYTTLPSTLPELDAFNGIPTGQYTSFGYETPVPDASVVNINSVDQADIDDMVANGWTYIIEGTLTQESDDATIDFLIEADVAQAYTDCALEDEEPGVNVQASSDAEITIHGDHIFFNGFPEDEGDINRQAAWLWQVGVEQDDDGTITREDLEAATNIGELFPTSPAGDYELTGSPVSPINNAWDFVRAQLATQGHLFGEGECEWGGI